MNASYKRVSKQTADTVDAANKRVDAAQRELWRVAERAADTHRRLLKHRAAVLSHSLRALERRAAPSTVGGADTDADAMGSGYSTPSRSAQLSPTSSVASAAASVSAKARFDGAHLFAGHENAVAPRRARGPLSAAEVGALEEKLRSTREALEAAEAQRAVAAQELAMVRAERENADAMLGVEAQRTEEARMDAEEAAARAEEMEERVRALEEERGAWERDRRTLDEREREVEVLERRLEVLEEQSGEAAQLQTIAATARAEGNEEAAQLRAEMERVRTAADAERARWAAEREELVERQKDEVDAAREELRALAQAHDIPMFSRELTLSALVTGIGKHLETRGGGAGRREDVEARRRLEAQAEADAEQRRALMQELSAARADTKELEARLRVSNACAPVHPSLTPLLGPTRSKPTALRILQRNAHRCPRSSTPATPRRSSRSCSLCGASCRRPRRARR